MDNRKYVVFIKNKNRTDEIESCTLKNNIYNIYFKDSRQLYLYNTNQVKFYDVENIEETNFEDIIITYDNIYKSGKIYFLKENYTNEKTKMFVANKKTYLTTFDILKPISNITDLSNKIIRCNGTVFPSIKNIYVYNEYYKIVFKAGLCKVYEKTTISISEQINDLPLVNYFKSVSTDLKKYMPIYTYLNDIYNSMLVDSSSIFYNYVQEPKVVEQKEKIRLFYPFNFNESQIKAIENAFSYNISYVETPTGNGKTHTILNLICNAIIYNKTVAIVSNNQLFLNYIRKKLEKYNLGFLFAFLDSTENTEYFFENQPTLPDITLWKRDFKSKEALKKELKNLENDILRYLKIKTNLAQKKMELSKILKEFEHFKSMYSENEINLCNFPLLNLSQLNNLLIDLYIYFNSNNLSLYNKTKLLWKYDFLDFKNLKENRKELELSLQRCIYEKRIKKLNEEINDLQNIISNHNLYGLQNSYLDKAMELFKSYLYTRYENIKDTTFLYSNYKNNFYGFIKKYPILLATPYSIKSSIKENYIFDYIIFDDAISIDLLEAGVSLSCARNAVIFGDIKKLPKYVDKSINNKCKNTITDFNLNKTYDYSNNILSSINNVYKDIPTTFLNEHYVSDPTIVGFCNEFFYENKMIIHSQENTKNFPMIYIDYYTVEKGEENSNILDIAPYLNLEKEDNKDILLITPFIGDYKQMQDGLEPNDIRDIIKKFKETIRNIVVLSTVIINTSKNDEYLKNLLYNSNLINDAISKAKKRFILVVDKRIKYSENNNLRLLTDYIDYQNISDNITKSNLKPICPILLKEFSFILLNQFISKYRSNKFLDEEKLAHNLIKEVFTKEAYKNFDFIFGLSIGNIIKNYSNLVEEERNFIDKDYFETYFVVYKKTNKMPILVIDVDNFTFHRNRRNGSEINMKKHILAKYNVEYIVWNNDGQGDALGLMNVLDNIIAKET